jgi:hypothetical protein
MQSQTIEIDREFVEQTLADLIDSKDLLCRERDNIVRRIDALTQRIQSLESKLSQAGRGGANGKKPRLRKGEGIAAILNALNGPDGLGMSQAQISERTGIAGSTVFRLLNKNADKVALGVDMLWRKK